MARGTSLPVIIAARHVRLSKLHHEVLFGSAEQLAMVPLPPTGTYATPDVVTVRGPAGALPAVRVVGPAVAHTEVRLSHRDVQALALTPSSSVPATMACTLAGPRGSVVLVEGVVVGLRRLGLSLEVARAAGLNDGGRAAVRLHGERPRELRDVPVEIGEACWLAIDVDDANALDVRPGSHATLA